MIPITAEEEAAFRRAARTVQAHLKPGQDVAIVEADPKLGPFQVIMLDADDRDGDVLAITIPTEWGEDPDVETFLHGILSQEDKILHGEKFD